MKMTKEEMIMEARKKPELPKSYMELLVESGFMTGTHKYGMPNGRPLDQDWVVNTPPHVFDDYCVGNEGNDSGYWEASGMTTLYGYHRGDLINIICIGDIDMFHAWFMTTQFMQFLENMPVKTRRWDRTGTNDVRILKDRFKNKYNRVRVFRALRDILYPVDKFRDSERMPIYEAFRYRKCIICKQEARNFTCKAERVKYEADGICERCRSL